MQLEAQSFGDASDLELALKVLVQTARNHARKHNQIDPFDTVAISVSTARLHVEALTDGSFVYRIELK